MPQAKPDTLFLTVSDRLFFPGTLAVVNSIRQYHPEAEIRVVSSGEYNQPLTEAQKGLLSRAGVIVHDHTDLAKPGRVLGAWQLKAYGASDLSEGYKALVGIDSDTVLCGPMQDVIDACLMDGAWRGGRDGDGAHYDDRYAVYGFPIPADNDKYTSTSCYCCALTDENQRILSTWDEYSDKACYGPQSEKVYEGHGDQGVLNCILHREKAGVEQLDNDVWSQHWCYDTDIIDCRGSALVNVTKASKPMRMLHCGGTRKFWSKVHSDWLLEAGQNQRWSYAWWLAHLWFGECTDWAVDPYQWLAPESYHLCQDLLAYYPMIQALRPDAADQWARMTDCVLERCVGNVRRAMSLGGSMNTYIDLAKQVPDVGRVVEVGSYFGGSILTLAAALLHRDISLYSVESFQGDGNGSVDGLALASPKAYLENVRGKHPLLNVQIVPLASEHAARCFADGSIDMVFIDGCHSTEAVKRDIAIWGPKLRPGGILAGDDANWPTVAAGVRESLGEHQEKNAVWWVNV